VDFTDVVRRRHMVRQFTDEPIAPESLDRILRNAVRGPSAGFSQGQAFLVLTGPDLKRFWAVADAAAAPSVTAAPLVIVPDEGLGALYFGIVPEAVEPFRAAFGVPADHEPIGAIAIGHDAEPAPRDLAARRRPAQEVIHYGRW
jgi:nitroreductase